MIILMVGNYYNVFNKLRIDKGDVHIIYITRSVVLSYINIPPGPIVSLASRHPGSRTGIISTVKTYILF